MHDNQGPAATEQRLYGTTIGQISFEERSDDETWPRPPSETRVWELLSTQVMPGQWGGTFVLIWTWGDIE